MLDAIHIYTHTHAFGGGMHVFALMFSSCSFTLDQWWVVDFIYTNGKMNSPVHYFISKQICIYRCTYIVYQHLSVCNQAIIWNN